ncbi:glycosyltransferase family 2 protein [Macrolepiota fuliginosa MF-IS2]|uniref:Glycosyltransferase family 2 protein n=1 Tax=Macrolepiota fuliginosa MF-IS2 TaxID=1400762 RepID=A0A9P6BVY4_9AGAR|nr:glycosyltransferase family 2 protein [Macrolepiota fuliginosa MF-IS2]
MSLIIDCDQCFDHSNLNLSLVLSLVWPVVSLCHLHTLDTHKPLPVLSQIIQDYLESHVNTLYTKNLLHLGEDQYLTALIFKHFLMFKTQFIHNAHAYIVAPDDWKVLLSQCQCWINLTMHNLGRFHFLGLALWL